MRPIFHLSMVEKHFRSLFSLILVLSVFYKAFSDELNSDRTASFKCTTDGLFEDENNCQMYYECLWVGTMFEKQEHVRCPRKLIYNPRKHRCDNIFEFENQFANGIQTGEELIEFMRFRNCIGTRNLVIGAGGEEDAGGGGGATISDDSTSPRPYNTNEDPYYSVLVANTSPPTDYWPPKLYLFDEGAQANTAAATDDTTTTTSTSTTSTEPITSEDSKKIKTTATETTETTKSRQSPTTETSSSSSSSSTTTTTIATTNGKSTLESETDLKQRFLPLSESILSSKKLKRVFTPPASQQGTKHQPKRTNLDKLLDMATTNKHQQAVEIETNKIISEPTETTFVNRNNGSSLSSSSSINGMKTNNGTFIIFGSESMLASINKPSDASLNAGVGAVKSKMSLRKRNRKLNPTFLKRRLLSVNDIEESSTTFDDDEFESPTTILDDEEIESTDASYHDKEAAIHEFTNKIINDFNQNHNQSTNTTTKSTTTTTTTASIDISTSTITTTTNETTVQANLIDSIEQRLTKRGENAVRIEKKLVVENSTSKVVLLKGPAVVSTTTEENKEPVMISLSLVHEDDSSTIPEYSTTTRNYKITASSRPLKFLKMLPAVNMSTVEHEKKQLKLDKLNDMFERKLGSVKHQKIEQPKSQIGDTETNLELDELANASKQQRTHRKLPTRTSSTYSSTPMPETATGSSTPYVLVTSGWTTPRGLNVSRVLSSTLSWTSSVAADPATNPAAPAVNGFVPSKTNSKPFMQTYKINQSPKHLPNQFASLRLNYAAGSGKIEDSISVSTAPEASSFISTNVYTDATTTNPFTKIDELERGGKFQRLRLVPADTLIECKENDFGLECSCSITLSPPRCKQLINSFLSSCRILGCKNSGKCINMSYKYPIPYVCSCPSGFMGTYCEIKRGDPTSSSAASSKEDKDSGLILTPVLRPKSQIDSAHRSYSSPYKLHPTNGVKQKTATTSTPATTTEATSILEEHTSTRVFELKSSSATFNLSLATFNRLTTQLPKLKKTFTTTPDFEFKEPLCEPNPCQNDAKCMVINDKIRCLCINSSYTGKYCEHTKLSHHHHRHHTTSTSMTSVDPETTPEGIIEITTSTMAMTSSGRRRTTTGGSGNTQAAATSTSSSEQRYAYYQSSTSAPRGFKHVSTLLPIPINNHDESSTPLPFYQVQKQPTTRAYFWQCPSNCFYSLGRGFCALSQSGYPHCVCHMGWTSVDCSQKNYCADNDCSNNSTCVNYPETSTYICLCPPGYSGRFCESHMSNRVVLEVKDKEKESSSTLTPNKNFYRLVTPTMDNNQQSHQQSDIKQQRLQSSILPPKNPCLTEKCKNNGTCVMSFSHAKNRFSFVCKCAPGFFGHLCENSTTTTVADATIVTPLLETDKAKPTPISPQSIAKNNRRVKPIFKSSSSSSSPSSTNPLDASFNPCTNDIDLCRKQPHGNASFICVKSFITQDYTLCLPTKSMSCKESNPCLNGGICVDQEDEIGGENSTKEPSGIRPPWRCICSVEYTGRLCETEICSPIHKLFANHTMCMPNSHKFVTGGLSSSDIDLILDMHNTLRRQVAPIASNMQKMYWDIRLQYLAQKRAQLCSVENTGILMRQQPGYGIVIGENLAAGYEKWAHVLSSWMGERKFFIYKSNSPTDNLQAGHYTQMIYSSASRIGCGFSQCTNTTYDRYFVCYYGEMQTYYSRYEPYQDGKSCSSCENNCENGLCDCKGAYCLNGGTMDLRTCTCSCPYSTFSGRYCENVICPSQDSPFCSQTLFEDKCWLYPVVRATCPYMCSLCTRYNENVNASVSSVSFNSVNENFRY